MIKKQNEKVHYTNLIKPSLKSKYSKVHSKKNGTIYNYVQQSVTPYNDLQLSKLNYTETI